MPPYSVVVSALDDGVLRINVPADAEVHYNLAATKRPAPTPEPVEYVGVRLRYFDSPSEAAKSERGLDAAFGGRGANRKFVYRAPKSLKLTVGERVSLPSPAYEGTVVSLNEDDPARKIGYVKDVVGRIV